jgi:hypothetical protein
MSLIVTRTWRTLLAAFLGAGVLVLTVGPRASASGTPPPSWSKLSPPSAPPALRNAAASYDSANQTVVVFGGRLADGALSGTTWVWDGSSWSAASPYGARPPPRQLASMAFDPMLDQLILFGGQGRGGALLDDTWVWNGASWNQIATPATPGDREGAALGADPAGHLVLFGGFGLSNEPRTVATPATTVAPAPTTVAVAPSTTTTTTTTPPAPTTTTPLTARGDAPVTTPTTTPKSAAATPATSDGARTAADVIELDAASGPRVLGDTWLLEQASDGVESWVPEPSHPAPGAVTGATLVDTGSETILFGGSSAGPGSPGTGEGGLSSATWAWDGHRWSSIKTKAAPPARRGAIGAYDIDLGRLVVFGGAGAGGVLGDTWAFAGRSWTRLTPSSPPTPRSGAVGAYDEASRQLVLFGGSDATGAALDDTEVLTRLAPRSIATSPPGGATATAPASSTAGTTAVGSTSGRSGTPTTKPDGVRRSSSAPLVATATTLHRGDVITLTGAGFLPGARIAITFHSAAVVVATTRADADGAFRVFVTVPDQAAMGPHRFEATGEGPHGLTTLITPVTVVALAVSHAVPTAVTLALVGIAVAIPLLTWLIFSTNSAWRRRAVRA